MFGLFEKKQPQRSVQPYHKDNDLNEAGYKQAIELLAKTTEPEWLASQKSNAAIILASLDMTQGNKHENGKPAERVRKMIEQMTNDEYVNWVRTVVFH